MCWHRPGAHTFSSVRIFSTLYSLKERAATGQGAKRRQHGWLLACHHSALLLIAVRRSLSGPTGSPCWKWESTAGLEAASDFWVQHTKSARDIGTILVNWQPHNLPLWTQDMQLPEIPSLWSLSTFKFRRETARAFVSAVTTCSFYRKRSLMLLLASIWADVTKSSAFHVPEQASTGGLLCFS